VIYSIDIDPQAQKSIAALHTDTLSALADALIPLELSPLSGRSVNAEKTPTPRWELAVRPGKLKPPTVTLKRGKNGSMELWAWHESVRKGAMDAARRSCSLIMYNAAGTPVAKYWLEKAWPSKLEISAMKAGASEVMYETVTLVCEHMQRVAP